MFVIHGSWLWGGWGGANSVYDTERDNSFMLLSGCAAAAVFGINTIFNLRNIVFDFIFWRCDGNGGGCCGCV